MKNKIIFSLLLTLFLFANCFGSAANDDQSLTERTELTDTELPDFFRVVEHQGKLVKIAKAAMEIYDYVQPVYHYKNGNPFKNIVTAARLFKSGIFEDIEDTPGLCGLCRKKYINLELEGSYSEFMGIVNHFAAKGESAHIYDLPQNNNEAMLRTAVSLKAHNEAMLRTAVSLKAHPDILALLKPKVE